MVKKLLGIFYKSWWLWMHYIPLALLSVLTVNLVAHLFGYHQVHNIWFNIVLFIILYVIQAISDQFVHAILGLFGVKD